MSRQPHKGPPARGRAEARSTKKNPPKKRLPAENIFNNVQQSSTPPEQGSRTSSQPLSKEAELRHPPNLSPAQRGWDKISQDYDTCDGQSWHRKFAPDVIEWVPPHKGAKVLDLGCGTGTYALLAAQAVGPTGVVVAVDFSNGMLSRLKEKKAREPQLYRNVLTICHDVTDLSSCEFLHALNRKYGGFDIVTCLACLSVLDRQNELVCQWTQFLKAGGQMVLEVPSADNNLNNVYLDVKRSLCHPSQAHRFSRDLDLHALQLLAMAAGLELESSWRTQSYNGETNLNMEDCDMALEVTGFKELSSEFGERRVTRVWRRMFIDSLDSNGSLCDGFWRSVVIARKRRA